MKVTAWWAIAAAGLAVSGCDSASIDEPTATGAATTAPPTAANPPAIPSGDWPRINRDLAASRYSPLDQINTANVASLQPSWTYQLGGNSTAVPIVVAGIMYVPSRDRVVALDADTGAEIWAYVLPAPPAPTTPPAGAPPAGAGGPGGPPTVSTRGRELLAR